MKRRYFQFISHILSLGGSAFSLFFAVLYGERVYWLFAIFFVCLSLLAYGYALAALLCLRLRLEVTPAQVYRGDKATLTVHMEKRFPFPLPRILLYIKLNENQKKPYLYRTSALEGPAAQLRVPMHYGVKGVYTGTLAAYGVGDALGLTFLLPFFKKNKYTATLYVKPRILPAGYDLAAGEKQNEADSSAPQLNTVFAGDVREYMYGDPLKSVHWKLSARLNKLFVKKYEDESLPVLYIILCTRRDGDIWFDQFACELALSVGSYCLENAIELCFFAGARSFGCIRSKESLEMLALDMSREHMTALGGCAAGRKGHRRLYITDKVGMDSLQYRQSDLYFYIHDMDDRESSLTESPESNILIVPYRKSTLFTGEEKKS